VTPERRVRWHAEISVRLALVVATLMLTTMVAMHVYYTRAQVQIRTWLHGDVQPDYDGHLVGAPPGTELYDEGGRRLVTEEEWQRKGDQVDRVVGLGAGLVGVITSLAVGWVISRRVTRPLRRMARALQTPIVEGRALPGPFDAGRPDELGVLAGALNDMRMKIQALVGELEKRDLERREWIALVSHDLRNPLQALTACIDRATAEAHNIQNDDRRVSMKDLLATARMDVDRFEVLTQDLLDIARLDAGNALQLEPVPPGELARAAGRSMRVLAESHGRTLQVKVQPRCPELVGDGRRLLRAIENLLRNAIQHATGSVVLRVTRGEDPTVPTVRFAVDDDGGGLPLEQDGAVEVTRLGAYKSRDDSSGLGLVVARRFAEAHGGRIGGYNRSGSSAATIAGATVWFEVPIGDRRAAGLDSDFIDDE